MALENTQLSSKFVEFQNDLESILARNYNWKTSIISITMLIQQMKSEIESKTMRLETNIKRLSEEKRKLGINRKNAINEFERRNSELDIEITKFSERLESLSVQNNEYHNQNIDIFGNYDENIDNNEDSLFVNEQIQSKKQQIFLLDQQRMNIKANLNSYKDLSQQISVVLEQNYSIRIGESQIWTIIRRLKRMKELYDVRSNKNSILGEIEIAQLELKHKYINIHSLEEDIEDETISNKIIAEKMKINTLCAEINRLSKAKKVASSSMEQFRKKLYMDDMKHRIKILFIHINEITKRVQSLQNRLYEKRTRINRVFY